MPRMRLMALMLSLAMLLAACGQAQPAAAPQASAAPAQVQQWEAGQAVPPETKTETVYAKASADGTVRESTVTVVLKTGGGGQLQDTSTLSNIKNTGGDEEYIREGDSIIWQNLGEDITYEGDGGTALPVGVRVSATLDGQSIAPAQLAGKSGHVTLKFDYRNDSAYTAQDGQTVAVPFVALTMLLLPGDSFKNIEIDNGQLMELDGQQLAVGYACPGLAASLDLAGYDPTEDIELPESVEISADVQDFALDFTATAFTTGLFDEVEDEDIDSLGDIREDMDKLTDAMAELLDGTAELLDGGVEFGDYLRQYTEGAAALEEGAAALDEGTAALKEGTQTLEDNKAALQQGADALRDGLAQLNTALAAVQLPTATATATAESATALTTAMQALGTDAQSLGAALEKTTAALMGLQGYAGQLAQWQGQAAAAAAALAQQNLTAAAKTQAQDAVAAALDADTTITEEQRDALKAAANAELEARLDLSAQQAQLNDMLAVLAAAPAPPDMTALSAESLGAITALIQDMAVQLQTLQTVMEALSAQMGQLSAMGETLTQLQTAVAQLAGGSSQLSAGVGQFAEGIAQLNDGAAQLKDGTAQLAESAASLNEAGGELNDGYATLVDGLRELKNGVAEFDGEGIQKLADLAGDDLTALRARLRAVKQADDAYQTFTALPEGTTGSVRFIIETEEIKL